jgi:Bacterial regulatory protein, arsR family
MISFVLGVEDLADTRFALSPVHEALLSLRVLQDPGLSALHLPWRRDVLTRLGDIDAGLLMSLVARRRTIPDFLTPNPVDFAPDFAREVAVVRQVRPAQVRHDLLLAHAPDPPPDALRAAVEGDDGQVAALRDAICDVLERYWELALKPIWARARLVAEADMTYRARRLAIGGARLLFADMHPNLRWQDGVLHIDQMISQHRVEAAGRGLLLMPSVFAHKPAPPVSPDEAPSLVYPCRGTATLFAPVPVATPAALTSLLGAPRVRLLILLAEPLPTVELARRLDVTPSAVSQHLRVLHATGLVTRARDGRQVLYQRSALGDQLAP